ncbi:MAG: hypothetical protein ACLPT4_12335 [Verrucomicrobiia bacterium]
MNEINGTTKTTSLRRLEANRRNCRSSTGPKTAKGKIQSRMNAVKHGMRSSLVVVRGLQVRERTKDFQKLREQLWGKLAPVGPVEEILVDRIVTALWRIRRVLMAEAGEIELSVDGGHWKRKECEPEMFQRSFSGFHDPVVEMEESARQSPEALPSLAVLDKIVRFEATAERQLYRAMNQLERLQRRRNGEQVPPLLAMEVSRRM